MRCFIAIDLPKEVLIQIRTIIDSISPLSKDIRWVPYENIHLTLKFLGDVEDALVLEIEQKIGRLCKIHKPFTIKVQGTGAFPNEKKANVLWIGIDKSDKLKELYSDLDNLMSEIGFEKESRKYYPHITIGRVKNNKNISQIIKGLNEYKDRLFGIAEIKEVHLMKSVLHSSGAKYSKISSFRLLE